MCILILKKKSMSILFYHNLTKYILNKNVSMTTKKTNNTIDLKYFPVSKVLIVIKIDSRNSKKMYILMYKI